MNPHIIEIYTDGSCHTQQTNGAWASVILYAGKRFELSGEETNTTHNRMELLAVIESIKFINTEQFILETHGSASITRETHGSASITVYTDSQYVCGIPERKEKLKHHQFITKKGKPLQNADLVKLLIQQIESYAIRFVKVKAHQKANTKSSIINSEVDKLSRQMVRERKFDR